MPDVPSFAHGEPLAARNLVAEMHASLMAYPMPWVDGMLAIGLFPVAGIPDLQVVPRAYLVFADGGEHPWALAEWDQFVSEETINAAIDAYGHVPVPTLLWLHITRATPVDHVPASYPSLTVRRLPSLTPTSLDDPTVIGSIAVGVLDRAN